MRCAARRAENIAAGMRGKWEYKILSTMLMVQGNRFSGLLGLNALSLESD